MDYSPEQDQEKYQQYYETVAEQKSIWTTPRNSPTYFQEMIRYEQVIKHLPKEPSTIIDLGCGDGYLSYLMAQKGHRVTSVDLADSRLQKFSEIARELGIKQIRADIAHTGLPAGSADVIVCSEVLEHIPDYFAVLQEAHRLLKGGGRFVITVPYKERLKTIVCPHCLKPFYPDGHLHRFDRTNLATDLRKAGFTVAKQKTFRHRLLVHLQYHLNMKYGFLLRGLDRVFSALMPEFTWYLLIVAQK